jgi:hypothetical protein
MQRILLVIPSFDWNIHFKLHDWIEEIELPEGFEVKVEVISRKLIHVARNLAINNAIVWKYDYLCMIDDDSVPCRKDALKLLIEADKDIIGWIYRKRSNPDLLCLYEIVEDKKNKFFDFKEYKEIPETDWDIFEVGNIWTGFVLYKIEFLKKIFWAYDFMPFENKLVHFIPTMTNERVEIERFVGSPLIKIDADWKLKVMKVPLSEDLLFHNRARLWGYKIYTHKQVLVDHYEGQKLLSVM